MHTLIIGRTGSGKSAIAKQIGSHLREDGKEVIALNPTGEAGYTKKDRFGCAAAEWETHDPAEFVREVVRRLDGKKKVRFLIVDEAHELFGKIDAHNALWIAQRGRHDGLNIIGITQRGAAIHTTFRTQCARIYVFRCSMTDSKFMADEGGSPTVKQAHELDTGEYFLITPEGVDKGRIVLRK